jgi:triacylglycerol lipase
MDPEIPYSPASDDLFNPGKREGFFLNGRPAEEPALCAELARLAYCRQESDFAFDQDRVRRILHEIGFSSCQFFESKGTPPSEGAHCFVAQDHSANLAVIVFRGTDATDASSLAFDADFPRKLWPKGGEVHEGFAHALARMATNLLPALKPVENLRKLYTGHGIGAAMASLVASLHKTDESQARDALYTFGSPRVGDEGFVVSLRGVQGRRYVNCCDLAADLPLDANGFRHFGRPYYIDRNREITFDLDEAAKHDDQTQAQAEFVAKYSGPEDVPARNLADHAPINYVWPVTAKP